MQKKRAYHLLMAPWVTRMVNPISFSAFSMYIPLFKLFYTSGSLIYSSRASVIPCVTDMPYVSLTCPVCHWHAPCVTDMPRVSLTCPVCHWHAPCVTDMPRVSLTCPVCHWHAPCVTDMPRVSLTCPMCHWHAPCVTDMPHVSLTCPMCHWHAPCVTDMPRVSLTCPVCHWYAPCVTDMSHMDTLVSQRGLWKNTKPEIDSSCLLGLQTRGYFSAMSFQAFTISCEKTCI